MTYLTAGELDVCAQVRAMCACIRTSESADDARVRMVSLTLEGAAVLATALERWEAMQIVVEERFGRARLSALYGELEALRDVIEA